jgi:predicted amidophosphoribosyltransferase
MISFDPTMLQRNIDTVLKTKMRGEERLQNMENAFVNSQSLKELEIGIIDNVLTTGVANCLRRNF